jgi:hypothetical protein
MLALAPAFHLPELSPALALRTAVADCLNNLTSKINAAKMRGQQKPGGHQCSKT